VARISRHLVAQSRKPARKREFSASWREIRAMAIDDETGDHVAPDLMSWSAVFLAHIAAGGHTTNGRPA